MMSKDFDIDFDFDREYGYHTDSDKNSRDQDDFDLDAILARELGPDFDALFEEEYAASQAALNAELAQAAAEAEAAPAEPETRFIDGYTQLDDAEEEEDAGEPMDDIDAIFAASSAAIDAATADVVTVKNPEPAETGEVIPDEQPETDDIPPMRRPVRRPRPKGVSLSAITEKVDLQGVKNVLAGTGVVIAENSKNFVDAVKECKPGTKMDKKQKRRFKNDVLPILIGAASVLMCLIFIIGSLSRGFNSEDRKEAALQESIAQAEAEAAAAAEIQRILNTAAVQASGYDFQGAIDTLDSYKDAETGRELTDEMATARAEYAAALTDLVVWDDPAAIVNLSFHLLIEDTNRAYADSSFAGSYRKNFITTAQFAEILAQLYENGYVLVNLDSIISAATDDAGNTTYTIKPLYLPSDKTPIMITETLVNYFDYMVDSDGDGQPDAGGDGFAHRLVVDGGKIKAEYMDAAGQTHVGDYDLVPILDTFIDAHPDFSYRGAKAILAVTGDEGIFGWRTNRDETLADGARDIVEILRAEGYQIACNSYSNLDYGTTSLAEISNDLIKWKQNTLPLLGEVDILVNARGGSLDAPASMAEAGSRFSAIYDAGFRYIIDAADSPTANLTAEFFSQSRLMVVGSKLDSGAYDAYFDLTP